MLDQTPMTREGLPLSDDAEKDGGYFVIPRKVALWSLIPIIAFLSSQWIALERLQDRQQDMKIEIDKLANAAEKQAELRANATADSARMSERMAALEALIRETRDLVREAMRSQRTP
jgi:hypothetical protein